MSYFQRHLFICTNDRGNPCKPSCNHQDRGNAALDFLRTHARQAGLMGKGKLRISGSSCLGRCAQGPVMVIYPEARWYRYTDEADLSDIFHQDLTEGKTVSRLLLDD